MSSPNLDRRTLLKLAGLGSAAYLGSASWLTSAAHLLAREAETSRTGEPAQSIIVLWMAGGPSQLETFDPHAGTKIGGDTKAIRTAAAGIELADGMELLAEQMQSVALIRSVVSKEGDHERGTYLVKTGYRPDPTAVHPSIGAICCHELPTLKTEIPRHISILPNQWPGRGGFLGDVFDAFKAGDPLGKVPDVSSNVSVPRFRQRLEDLEVVERVFARGRKRQVDATLHRVGVQGARAMMTSEQLAAFDVSQEPIEVRAAYGHTPFGRGCLAARRLIEVGVRCIEVTLDGWDSHVNNHETCQRRKQDLDPAFAALIADLKRHQLWDKTIVLCAGEFGRTPAINRLDGRDHWPSGFSMALAGGKLRGGVALGQTDPAGGRDVKAPRQVADVHATILTALGLDPAKENMSPVGRPLKLADGQAIKELLV